MRSILSRFALGTLPALAISLLGMPAADAAPPESVALMTVGERSDFRATALHADVVGVLDAIAKASPLATRGSLGKSEEGRDIPTIIMSDPPVADAVAARTLAIKDGRLIVIAIGNIHAGEVDGKEALPMLARQLLGLEGEGEDDLRPLLKHLIVVFAPIYNCDGNERVNKTNRPGQIGPEDGMGIRENAKGLDLNRDFIKVESPECAGLVKFFVDWDPAVFIDCHTTNGSFHRYVLTYAGPKLPAGDAKLNEYCRETFFPALGRSFDRRSGQRSFWYGSFEGAFTDGPRGINKHTQWETFPAEGRYGTNYFGLRNRISILSEAYSYATFKERVLATRGFVRSSLELTSENREVIAALLKQADERAVGAGDRSTPVAIRTKAAPWPDKVSVLGYVEEEKDGRIHSTGKEATYEVELWDRFESTLSVPRPWAYVIPRNSETVGLINKVRQHGIAIEELPAGSELEVTALTVTDVTQATRAYQNHVIARVDVKDEHRHIKLDSPAALVRTGQPLGNLVCYLLEPACEDGLTAWNYLDRWLRVGEELPVYRLPEPLPTR